MIAPSSMAFWNSSAGVSFDVSKISSPFTPATSESTSSARLEQSVPAPSSWRICTMRGFGSALTANWLRNFGAQRNAWFSARSALRIFFSS